MIERPPGTGPEFPPAAFGTRGKEQTRMHDHSTPNPGGPTGATARNEFLESSGIARRAHRSEVSISVRPLAEPHTDKVGLSEMNSGLIPTYDEFLELIEAAEGFYEVVSHDEITKHNWSINEEFVRSQYGYTKKFDDASVASKPKSSPDEGYVYLLQGQGCYKIGRAKNPERRSELLAIQLPFPVELVLTIGTRNYKALELILHARFAERRLNGEWFDLDPEDVGFLEELAAMDAEKDAMDVWERGSR